MTSSRAIVFHGNATTTSGGLKKSDLVKNPKTGEIVSKDKRAAGKKNPWIKATEAAKKKLKIKGFAFPTKGSEFYAVARSIYDSKK